MRILLAMIEPPNPFGNAASRWYYVLFKNLVERGHEVVAFAASSSEKDSDRAKELFPDSNFDLRIFPFPKRQGLGSKIETVLRPYVFMFSKEFLRSWSQECKLGFDIMHLEQLWCGWLGQNHVNRALINVHHLQTIDLEQTTAESWKESVNYQLIFRTERKLIEKYRFIRSCSPRLEKPMREWNSAAKIWTVPVGLDPELYEFIPTEKRNPKKVVSIIGNLGW